MMAQSRLVGDHVRAQRSASTCTPLSPVHPVSTFCMPSSVLGMRDTAVDTAPGPVPSALPGFPLAWDPSSVPAHPPLGSKTEPSLYS